ncbi:peptidylprolyl isomerase [Maridesulfovibrio hydrothermalis]|uniref:Periplasmic chaperone PpiD n=1 Tax=Maridesulfovibrio hydrothermalis AM13 = DSM 14728 TaxID=1121451 RepID=L0R7X3_9BACT|nr:SurA N-terminal domain-containing protein [Maridesulfovibrio hydrothermalis]CCO22838.1 PpiC-type peptidyl-prolyl cis-trans isomerase [Maridesulfovibrio hydrothermalis AM13 = DSM 14728]
MMDILRQNAQNWGIKILFAIIIIVFVFAFGMSGFEGNTDPVIAYVNDEPIPTREFQQVYRETAEAMRTQNPGIDSDQLQSPDFKKAVLNQMISQQLLEAEAQRLGIAVSNGELSYTISTIPAFAGTDGKFDLTRYQNFLQSRQMSAATFERDVRNSNLIQKLQQYITLPVLPTEEQARELFDTASEKIQIDYVYISGADFIKKAKINDKAIEDYYKANPDKFTIPARAVIKYIAFTPEDLAMFEDVSPEEMKSYYAAQKDSFKQEEQIKARHILLMVDENAPEADIAKVEKRIKKILAKAKSGQDFGKLAEKYSEGPSNVKGGELGWFGRGAMVKPFEEAAFALKKGEISQPVRTRFGWHLIKIDDTREAGGKDFDQVKDEIRAAIAQEKASDSITDKLDNAIDLLASGMKLEKIADETGVSFKESEQATIQNLTRAFGMTEEAAKSILALPLGSSTEMPIAIDNGYLLAEKIQDIPASISPLADVKEDIKNFLSQQQAMQLAKVKAMYTIGMLTSEKTAAKELKSIKKDLKTSEPFGRDGFIPNLGMNPKLAEAAFAASKDKWLPQAFELPGGFIVARLDERIPPKEEAWEAQKDMIMDALEQQRANEVFNAFLNELRSKAKIEVVRKDLLN